MSLEAAAGAAPVILTVVVNEEMGTGRGVSSADVVRWVGMRACRLVVCTV